MLGSVCGSRVDTWHKWKINGSCVVSLQDSTMQLQKDINITVSRARLAPHENKIETRDGMSACIPLAEH